MLSERFGQALAFAHQLHRKQKRKTSGAPYIAHLLGVAALVLEDGGSEDQAIAALLHDSIEDQGAGYPGGGDQLARDLEAKFGPEVHRIVEACTERRGPPHPGDRRAQWRAHKTAYLAIIGTSDEAVRRVSCADALYNVRSLVASYRVFGDALWTRFRTRQRDDQLWFYDALARVFNEAGPPGLAAQLDRAVEEIWCDAGLSRPLS